VKPQTLGDSPGSDINEVEMGRIASGLKVALAMAALAPSLLVSAPAQAHNNDAGALIGGLVAGALIGGAVTAATRPRPYYYYPPPPPPAYYAPPPGPVYGGGYCGAPPYPPCRTPVPY